MQRLPRVGLAALAVLVSGCGPAGTEGGRDVAARGSMSLVDAAAASGVYEVRGVTVQSLTGRQRAIAGVLNLGVEGERYRVSFELDTTAPEVGSEASVRVRGDGRGFIVGRIFSGTTEQWMSLKGPAAARDRPLPPGVGLKLVSSSQASFDDAGVFQILLQNQPAPGQRYTPSITTLAGRRVRDLPADAVTSWAED